MVWKRYNPLPVHSHLQSVCLTGHHAPSQWSFQSAHIATVPQNPCFVQYKPIPETSAMWQNFKCSVQDRRKSHVCVSRTGKNDVETLCVNDTGKSEAVSKAHLCALDPRGILSCIP